MNVPQPSPGLVRRCALGFGAGLAHAALMALAFPPFGWWGLVFVAIAPLVWVATVFERRAPEPPGGRAVTRLVRRLLPYLAVMLGVAPLWAYECQWVVAVSELGYPPMVAVIAAFAGLYVWLVARTRHRLPGVPLWLVAPVVWVGLEVLRGEVVVYGYAWLLLGHPLIDAPSAPTLASVVGAYGASLVAAVPASVALAVLVPHDRAIKSGVISLAVVSVLVFIGVVGIGAWLPTSRGAVPLVQPTLRVAVVQTNVPQDNKKDWTLEQRVRDLQRMLELTRSAAEASPRPDLIVWPETMFPGQFLEPVTLPTGKQAYLAVELVDAFLRTQEALGVPILVGAVGADGLRIEGSGDRARLTMDHRYNSAFLVTGGKPDATRYDKVELTPFGEVIPYAEHWPWLQQRVLDFAASGMAFDLSPGKRSDSLRFEVASAGAVRLATPICFEVTKAAHVRRLVNTSAPSPVILVNLSNDGWFGRFEAGKRQHLQIARWRAAELGVPMVRAVNTGISCFIDGSGRIVRGAGAGPASVDVDGVIAADLPLAGSRTAYGRFGYILAWVWLLAAGVLPFWPISKSGG